MKDNLTTCLQLIYGSEGGYVNHPSDPGGATKFGITAATLGAYRRLGRKATPGEVKGLTLAEAEQIIARQYAAPIRFDDLPAGLDYAVLDFAVNSGPAQAVKSLQKILGVDQDGVIGSKSLAAIAGHDAGELVRAYCAYRMQFLKGLTTWSTFGKGWSRRVSSVTTRAVAMAGGRQVQVALADPETATPAGLDAKADPKQTKVTATKTGQTGVLTLFGAAGNGAAQGLQTVADTSKSMADTIAPYADVLSVIKWVFAGLTIVGVVLTLYVTVQRIAAGNPQ